MKPVKIERMNNNELSVAWSDGHAGRHTLKNLRGSCPCAACKSDREASTHLVMLPVLNPGQFDLASIQTVGAYALQLVWGDGHRTGIYTFDYLRRVCECADCLKLNAE